MAEKTTEEILQEQLANPETYEFDGENIKNRSIPDVIRGLEALASLKRAKSGSVGLSICKPTGNSAV